MSIYVENPLKLKKLAPFPNFYGFHHNTRKIRHNKRNNPAMKRHGGVMN